MKHDVLSAASLRRSIYALGKNMPIPESRIRQIVEEALKQAPSPFNIQSAKAVILLGANHDELWDNLAGVLEGIVKDPAAFEQTKAKR